MNIKLFVWPIAWAKHSTTESIIKGDNGKTQGEREIEAPGRKI